MTDLRLPVTAAAAEGETKLGREEKEQHGKGREGEMEEIRPVILAPILPFSSFETSRVSNATCES